MNYFIKQFFTLSLVLLLCAVPLRTTFAAFNFDTLGLFTCDPGALDEITKKPTNDCDFNSVVKLVQNIFKAVTEILLIILPLLIAKAGFQFMLSAEIPAQRAAAKNQLWNILIGFAIMFGSWTIITLVLKIFLDAKVYNSIPFVN